MWLMIGRRRAVHAASASVLTTSLPVSAEPPNQHRAAAAASAGNRSAGRCCPSIHRPVSRPHGMAVRSRAVATQVYPLVSIPLQGMGPLLFTVRARSMTRLSPLFRLSVRADWNRQTVNIDIIPKLAKFFQANVLSYNALTCRIRKESDRLEFKFVRE